MALIIAGMSGIERNVWGNDGGGGDAPRAGEGVPAGSHGTQTTAEVRELAAVFRLSTGELLMEASMSRVLVLVFLRHFGCTFTRQLLRGLEQLQHTARTHRAELVLVHMLPGGGETRYLTEHAAVARISDPRRELYGAFGLKRGGWRELLGLHVWRLGIVSIFKGCGVGHLAGDGRQMPGVFLFHRGEIIAAQRAKSAADLPDLARLFDCLPDAAPAATNAAPDLP